MAKKRKNGSGTMRTRAGGRLEYRVSYVDEFGQVQRKSFYGDTEDECYEQADTFLEVQELKKRDSSCDRTIPDILKEKYTDDYEMNYVSEAAYDRNLATLKRIENHPIGSIPIININERQLESFIKSLTHYSNSVISKIHQQLKLAYAIALEDGIVGKNLMNSRKLSKRPKSSKKDRVVKGFTEEEQALFVKALEEDRIPRHRNNYKNQLKIELYTGMRMGEINALKKEDIDFDRSIIHVRGTISKGLNERNYLKDSTKTDKGIREIPMNDLVRPVLEEAIEKAPRNKYGLIFYDTNKKDVIATQQVNCYFKRLCHKANIDVRGQHALRHTFATRCIEAGIPAVVLKEWMGHTNIHITLDTYADVFNRMNNEAIKMFEKYTCAIKYVEKTT